MIDIARNPSSALDLDVRLSRFGQWFYFDIRHEDQRRWSAEISDFAERSIASVMAAIAMAYNAAANTDVPVLFVSSISPDVTFSRRDVADVSKIYADVNESPDGAEGLRYPYAVYATKSVPGLAALIETFGVFGMVFPLGVQANLWLQMGINSWDFVLNDRAAECLPDHVLQAFAEERLRLVPASPELSLHRKVRAEKTVVDFANPRSARFHKK